MDHHLHQPPHHTSTCRAHSGNVGIRFFVWNLILIKLQGVWYCIKINYKLITQVRKHRLSYQGDKISLWLEHFEKYFLSLDKCSFIFCLPPAEWGSHENENKIYRSHWPNFVFGIIFNSLYLKSFYLFSCKPITIYHLFRKHKDS